MSCCVSEYLSDGREKHVLGFVDAGRKVVRAPLVGMEFLHQRPMGAADLLGARAGLQGQGSDRPPPASFGPRGAAAPPRCRIGLRVLTPAGLPAVKIAASSARLSSSISASRPTQRRDVERVERRALRAARRGSRRASRRCRGRVPFRERPSARARPGPALFCVRCAEPGRAERHPAEQARARQPERRPRSRAGPRAARNAATPSSAMPPAELAASAASLRGSALEIFLRHPEQDGERPRSRRAASAWLSHLREQLLRARVAPRREVGERLDAAGRIGRGRAQQFGKFMRRADDRSGNRRRASAARSRGTPARRPRRGPPGT